ncbi:MAG: KH domain-containing protein [Acidimicrobiales bacterium]
MSAGDGGVSGVPPGGPHGLAPADGTADDGEDVDPANRVLGGRANAVLAYLARHIVDAPGDVQVAASAESGGVRLELFVAPDDMGKVIGRRGRVAQAIRSVVRAAAALEGVNVTVDIVD